MEEKVREALTEKAADGRITCAEARRLAETLGVSYREIGAAADKMGIRIKDCELGCF